MDMTKKRQEAAKLLSAEMPLEDAEESVFNMDDEQVLSVLGESEDDFLDNIGEHDETNYDPYAGCDVFERTGEEMDGENF